jgi:hypothetical protein
LQLPLRDNNASNPTKLKILITTEQTDKSQ